MKEGIERLKGEKKKGMQVDVDARMLKVIKERVIIRKG